VSDRSIPKVGQVYHHWRANDAYKIWSIQECFPEYFLEGEYFDWVGVEVKCASNILQGHTTVFYESCRSKRVYARTLSNFMEVLSSGKGEQASNSYRFELVE
jgi:hypothetical protein